MATNTGTYYILFEGIEEGVNDEPNAFAALEEFYENVLSDYENTLSEGYANKDAGLFVFKLTGVSDEQAELLEEDPDSVVRSDFDGFATETVKSWKSDESAWSEASKADIVEEGEPDADGYYRPEGYADPE